MLSDEATNVLNLIQLFKFFHRIAFPHRNLHDTLNYVLRAATKCVSHCCIENAEQCLQNE